MRIRIGKLNSSAFLVIALSAFYLAPLHKPNGNPWKVNFVRKIGRVQKLLEEAKKMMEGNNERKALKLLEEAGEDIDKVIKGIVLHLREPWPPLDETMGPRVRRLIKEKWPHIKKGAVSIILAKVVRSRDSMSVIYRSPITPSLVKWMVSFLPKYLDVDAEVKKVYWVGKKNCLGANIRRKDLAPGRKVYLTIEGRKGSAKLVEGREYWFVIGSPFTVNLDMAIAGGGRSMVVFFEEKKKDLCRPKIRKKKI